MFAQLPFFEKKKKRERRDLDLCHVVPEDRDVSRGKQAIINTQNSKKGMHCQKIISSSKITITTSHEIVQRIYQEFQQILSKKLPKV